jgi:hypothetical protein
MDSPGKKLREFAACSVAFDGGGAPIFKVVNGIVCQSGAFEDPPGDGGTGITNLTLAGGGIDESQCYHVITPAVLQAASRLQSFGLVHTSDTVKQITSVQEIDAGGASALANVPFNLVLFTYGAE